MSGGSLPSATKTTPLLTAPTTAQKRSIEETRQVVGPSGSSQIPDNASNSETSVKRRSRPIFNMRRTGHTRPFPLSARPLPQPLLQPAAVANGSIDKYNTPSPSISSPARNPSNLDAGLNLEFTPAPAFSKPTESPKKPVQSDLAGILTPTQADGTASPAQTQTKPVIGHGRSIAPKQSSSPVIGNRYIGAPGQESLLSSTVNQSMKPIIPPDVQQVFDSALDDRPYKTWLDESGTPIATSGALIPPGYKKSDDPVFSWVCPVRSCRKLLSSLQGLGKHFCNSHRATRFNDNMDGTLTDLGIYSDPAHGDGKSSGGFAKPSLIVSKKAMSLSNSPLVASSLHNNAVRMKPTVPQRGGPRRSSVLSKVFSEDNDSTDPDDEPVVEASRGRIRDTPQGPPLDTSSSRRLDMANPDRPYNTWIDKDGILVLLGGALIPDGYVHDTTLPDRPWICPIRSCRRLFKSHSDLGNHFRGHHRSSRLNDNLDGTFSVVGKTNGTAPAVVVSRNPMDFEPIVEPTRPTYPYKLSSNVIWVKATEAEIDATSTSPAEIDAISTPPPMNPRRETDAMDVVSDSDLDCTIEGRPYRQWWDDYGELVKMAGALIPQGYHLDLYSFPDRTWVCPVRTCRIACKSRKGLGYHFMTTHRSSNLNDNGDGTFSIVGSHKGKAPRVVSRNPPGPDEPPPIAPRVPPSTEEGRTAERPKNSAVLSRTTSSSVAHEPPARSATLPSDPNNIWDHISSRADILPTDREVPEVTILLRYPKIRDLNVVSAALLASANPRLVPSLILQVIGEQNPTPCTECRRHDGPFESCVSATAAIAQEVYPFLSTAARSCANCMARKEPHKCSLRKLRADARRARKGNPQRALEDGADADNPKLFVNPELPVDFSGHMEADDGVSTRRRSARLSMANDDVDSGEVDAETGEVAHAEPEPRPSRLVTFKVPNLAENDRKLRDRRSASINGKVPAPAATDLHVEGWEMGDGLVSLAGKPLAFSSAYLAANQTVQVSSNINFQAASIPSGRIHQIPADPTKTRICTLVSGKLTVQVGADEFVIGPQGIFTVVPGTACTLTNRCYADVVLHITSVNEE